MAEVKIAEKTKTRDEKQYGEPSQYTVVLHNDSVTLRDFVVLSLKKFFSKTEADSRKIMMKAHLEGQSAVGSYSYEIAETRTYRANEYSASEGYPLFYSIQKDN